MAGKLHSRVECESVLFNLFAYRVLWTAWAAAADHIGRPTSTRCLYNNNVWQVGRLSHSHTHHYPHSVRQK